MPAVGRNSWGQLAQVQAIQDSLCGRLNLSRMLFRFM
jgi:hypothetical protein